MKKIFTYLKPYFAFYCLAGFLILLTALADLMLPDIMKNIINNGIAKNDIYFILKMGSLMLGITLLNLICWIFSSYFSSKAAFYFARDLRKDIFKKIINSSIDEIDKIGTASLITRTTNDVATLELSIFRILRIGLVAPFIGFGGIFLAYKISPEISLIFIFVIIALTFIYILLIKKATPLFKKIFPKLDLLNKLTRENLTGIKILRAFNKESFQEKRFEKANKDLTLTNIEAKKILAWHSPITILFLNITIILILYIGAKKIDNNSFLPGELIAMTQYASLILSAFLRSSIIFRMFPQFNTAVIRIENLLNIKNNNQEKNCINKKIPLKFDINFSNVTFKYNNAEIPALKNINFTTKNGKTLAIIGGTGSGKSTIMQLLLRFYDDYEGEIKIGGINIKNIEKKDLREIISYTSQKSRIFSGSIAFNLKYGNNNASNKAINEVINITQIKNFILDQPNKYNTLIAQNGENFSGGQKQRITIARALLKKSKIFLFDDSFSALDFKTDSILQKNLKNQLKDKTVIIVAQRISTIMNADKIIVLNNGKIDNYGTHKELLKHSDFYRELATSQLSLKELSNE